MAKYIYIILLSLLYINIEAQISHGGKPLPLSNLRSSERNLFQDMPSFDVAEELRLDSLNESDMRSGFRFAYKFMTGFNRNNSGISFILPDGTKVWRLGIRSKGAYSINVLFTEYELPEGAQLFLYNADQSHILGAFNYLNNSDKQILPVAPVQGDELIIEYQEPANATFSGRLTVGEVNHAYRDFRGREPADNISTDSCIPPLVCYQSDENYSKWGQSAVLIAINGTTLCSAALINNTSNDGKPYLLTASHCLNNNKFAANTDYAEVAGTIVSFFNYESPLCKTIMRGSEEQSVASAELRAVNEDYDMVLLELKDTPPVYYRPYYAGWNVLNTGKAPYAGIQYPNGGTKRISLSESKLSTLTLEIPGIYNFAKEGHWQISRWDVGCTDHGSSGSPLFDAGGHIVGALTGGESTCSSPVNDYYYSLAQAWKNTEDLKKYLNPKNNDQSLCEGMDPYLYSPAYRLSNVYDSGKAEAVESTVFGESDKAPLFGNNSSEVNEYAEAYTANGDALLYGAYFITPAAGSGYNNLKINVTVYSGDNKPATLLHSERFQPSYTNKSTSSDTFQETVKSLNRSQASFIQFEKPVPVNGHFYIGYQIEEAPKDTYFSVFNLPKGVTTRNTTWINDHNTWVEASAYSQAGFNTSLFIDPVIQYNSPDGNEPVKVSNPIKIYVGPDHRSIHIILPDGTEQAAYTLLTTEGRTIQKGIIRNSQEMIPIHCIPGMYLMQITLRNNSYTQKIIL